MSFLRLGTRVAVINEAGQILLSKRGDFAVWALPGGRVDNHELIQNTAIREVREETGLEVEIVRPVGLYYQQGRQRMDILYRAKPIGGELFKTSDETLDNLFFSPDALPEPLFGHLQISHAYSDETHIYTIETAFWTLFKLEMQLRWRWIQNYRAGRPEPKFPKFIIRAVGIIRRDNKVFVQNSNLPTIISDGTMALDKALSRQIGANLEWCWLGLWQDPASDAMEFIFGAEGESKSGNWVQVDSLNEQHRKYLEMPTKQIWLLKNEV
jgi:ADP-ribose pyrophosphatase YjhB (NUDIX family)